MLRIDAHQHFWKYDPQHYGWIGANMNVLRRDYLPDDLAPELDRAGIAGTVAVQARTLNETEFLLDLAKTHDWIKGVVGWVDLTQQNAGEEILRLKANPKLVGLRHIVQDEPDPTYILRKDFNAGIRRVGQAGLTYDILIFERHLPQTILFVDSHPEQKFVLDHIAKPKIKAGQISPWRENIRELAKRPNLYCKISGMTTEADWGTWTSQQLAPYLDTVLECFGPRRLMFGSDWPVCLLATSYNGWVAVVQKAVDGLSIHDQEWIWAKTAQEAYGLS
jgi:L-fuconolactonase